MVQETLSLFQKETLSLLIPTAREAYMTRHKNSVPLFNVTHDYFKNSFFPSTVTVETSVHYLLHCPNFSNERLTFFNKLQSIDENIYVKTTRTFQKCFSLVMFI